MFEEFIVEAIRTRGFIIEQILDNFIYLFVSERRSQILSILNMNGHSIKYTLKIELHYENISFAHFFLKGISKYGSFGIMIRDFSRVIIFLA
jgi:hypothetical protein